jgi:hypothetical protein
MIDDLASGAEPQLLWGAGAGSEPPPAIAYGTNVTGGTTLTPSANVAVNR